MRGAGEQKRLEELIKELKHETEEVEKRSNELQQLSQSEDHILQVSALVIQPSL